MDRVAVTGHGFIDGVVQNLPHHMVQTSNTGGADIHAWPLANRF